MQELIDWFYITINIQTVWTNLIITFFANINNNYNQRIINDSHTYLINMIDKVKFFSKLLNIFDIRLNEIN